MNKRKSIIALIAVASIALLTQTSFSWHRGGWGWGGGWGGGWGWSWPYWGYPSYWYPSWSYDRDRDAEDRAYREGLRKGEETEEIKRLKEENKKLKEERDKKTTTKR